MLAAGIVPEWRWHCREKRRFRNIDQAQEALLLLCEAAARGEVARRPGVLNVYSCADCGFWHIGHLYPKEP